MRRLSLTPHPLALPSADQFEVWVTVEHAAAFGATATVNIWFGVGAPLHRFSVPEGSAGRRAHDLWRSTCFEAFLRPKGKASYREWNFAPSAAWQAYDFTSCRTGMADARVEQVPYIRVEDNFTWWALGATIAVDAAGEWDLALSAVLEDCNGGKSYWALAHPVPDRPDFHHPDCFVAHLP